MKKSIDLVKEFHKVFNHPIGKGPTIPHPDVVQFRTSFIT
jgi:predicted HAD superfamily Cof-like phosphohydrolase